MKVAASLLAVPALFFAVLGLIAAGRPATPLRRAGVGSLTTFEGRPGDRFLLVRRGVDSQGATTSLVPPVAWSSSNPAVARVETTLVMGQETTLTLGEPGEATITVRSPRLAASVLFRCVEDGAVALEVDAYELGPVPPLGF